MNSTPVVMITGFLGAGKTTLLNQLLRDPEFADSAILINEFGSVAIDHDLIAEFSADAIVTTSGCLCCSMGSDILQSLQKLSAREAAGEIRPFKRVIVETTGLADPVPVINTLLTALPSNASDHVVGRTYALAQVAALFDIVHGQDTLERHEEARRQLALADSVIITKADLIEPGRRTAREALERRFLSSINPSANLLDRHDDWPEIRSMLLAGGTYDLRSKGEDALAWLRAEEVLAKAGTEPGHAAQHRHSQDIRSHSIVIDGPVRPFRFRFFLDALRMSAGPDLLRVKGLVGLTDDVDRPIVLHGVQHIIDTSTRLDAWPGRDRRTRIVLIGRRLNVSAMRVILEPDQAVKGPTKNATGGMLHRAIEATSVFLPRPVGSRQDATREDIEPRTVKRNAARFEQ